MPSACKCLSIAPSTTTVTTQSAGGGQTVTANLGTTATPTSTVYASPTMTQLRLYAYAPGNLVNGRFLFGPFFAENGQVNPRVEQFGFPSYRSCCASYSIVDNGMLQQNGNPGGVLYENSGDCRVYRTSVSDLASGDTPLQCSWTWRADDSTCPMSC